MKKFKLIFIILFILIILAPLMAFNIKPNSISQIDNRALTENPFTLEGDLTQNIESYVNDRLGFRDEMITSYTVLNDRLFNKMVHPSYTYGKDGYVFGGGVSTSNDFGDFHMIFADMIEKVQHYCQERNIPFLFVFNPAKPAIYQDKIAEGVNYNRQWVDLFFKELERRNIDYLDNTGTMVELRDKGIQGFNIKYDANHWNDIGAFYGSNAILEKLKEKNENIHINKLDEFIQTKTLEKSLLVSKFPIDETVLKLKLKQKPKSLYEDYFSELKINPSYPGFGYFINESKNVENTPKALVFQGSYMNKLGYKYFINAFNEYIHVHDYQNIIEFPYYFNIFQPECVIFEVAEYTVIENYFDLERMKAIDFNPSLDNLSEEDYDELDLEDEDIKVDKGKTLTKINLNTDETYSYIWLSKGGIFDMYKVEGGYETTMETKKFESIKDSIKIYVKSAKSN
ncbi:hypothetical protein [Lagierella sp.]|uniref:alginate O-acetyltransferase AlgX-related protein n=1 Tax=Lagierella sp. TaxID=2849657 RepID=UPI00260E6527|nr:hypothetical protein [Lagierella sp.]